MVSSRAGRSQLGISTLDQAIVSGANFLVALLFARAVEPSAFGLFAVAYAGWLLIQGLGRAIVGQPMMMHPVAAVATRQRSFKLPADWAGLALTYVVCVEVLLVATIGLLRSLGVASTSITQVVEALAIGVPFLCLQDLARVAMLRSGALWSAALVDAAVGAVQLGGIALLADRHATPARAFSALGLGALVGLLLRAGIVPRPALTSLARTWQVSMDLGGRWFLSQFLMYWAYSQFAIVVSAGALTPAEAGGLRAVQMLFGFLPVFVLGFENFGLKQFSDVWHLSGQAALSRVMRSWAKKFALVGLPLIAVIAAAGMKFLPVLVGQSYSSFRILIPVVAAQSCLVMLSSPLIVALKASRNARWTFRARLAALLALVPVTVLLLAGRAGIAVMAVGAACAEALSIIVLLIGIRRHGPGGLATTSAARPEVALAG